MRLGTARLVPDSCSSRQFCVVVVTYLIDLVPKLMFTVLYSSCSDGCDMLPECTDADSECEENQTVDSISIFQS